MGMWADRDVSYDVLDALYGPLLIIMHFPKPFLLMQPELSTVNKEQTPNSSLEMSSAL